MLSISLPNISIQKVSNGYVVQWVKVNPDKTQSQRTMTATAVCLTKDSLLETIELAAIDIADIGGG